MAEQSKEVLVEKLALKRSEMDRSRSSLERELSISTQLKKSMYAHPGRWAAAGAGTAFMVARLARHKKATNSAGLKKRGIIIKIGKLIFSIARPALTTFAIKYAKDQLEARFGPFEDNSMLGGPPQK